MHLNTETAFDLLERRLDEDQEVFWRTHMEVCNTCAEEVSELQQLAIDLKRYHLASASEGEIENALRIFPSAKQQGSSIRSVVASIVFNGFFQPAMPGVRGASPEPVCQFILRDEDYDIHIKIWGDEKSRRIHGQLLPRSGQEFVSAQCHLLHKGARIQSTVTDATGEFQFNDAPEGELNLQVDLPNVTIVGSLSIQDDTLT